MMSAQAAPRDAALFGTFDVANYGDLLFPHVLAHLLGDGLATLRCYSPRGGAPAWADCWPARPLAAFTEDAAPRLCLIGGGNIIHASPTPLPDYAGVFGRSDFTYASLWLGASILAAQAGARLAWNAPGLPFPVEGAWARGLRDLVLPTADHVALRDEASRVYLGAPAEIVPDTALKLSSVWPAESLLATARDAFTSRGMAVPARWIAVHLNDRYIGGDLRAACAVVDRIAARLQAVPVLLAIGPCHGDDALARQAMAHLEGPALLVDQPEGLRQIAALIAHAEAYLGSSMHGLITALSYGRPGIAIARTRMVKFLGLLEPIGESARLQESWADAEAVAAALLQPLPQATHARLQAAMARIDAHAAVLRGLLASAPSPAVAAAQARLLQAVSAEPPAHAEWGLLLRAITGTSAAPDDPDAQCEALAAAMRGPADEALRQRIATARAAWPHHMRLMLLEAEWMERAGKVQEAETRLTTLLQQHPDNPWPAVRLVRLLARHGRVEAARSLYEKRLRDAAPAGIPHRELTRLLGAP
ncbi:polysaccharide pyruvyl transferase family protein [Falsiroseomonas sp.]|uniref:polysaccharide pyruvyl transferase family protein n=1 Tax=Falsiroseomonas sp. TaxID=2870721 RepID=UPI003F721B64